MSSPEERIAYLEGRVEEHTRGFEELRSSIGRLDDHVLAVDRKVDAVREELARRIDALDAKVDRFRDELSVRIDALDAKVDRFREELSARIDALDRKTSRQFTWIVGIQVTMLITLLGSLIR